MDHKLYEPCGDDANSFYFFHQFPVPDITRLLALYPYYSITHTLPAPITLPTATTTSTSGTTITSITTSTTTTPTTTAHSRSEISIKFSSYIISRSLIFNSVTLHLVLMQPRVVMLRDLQHQC